MSWFKRNKEGITTTTSEKKEVPEGLWSRCSNCKTIFTKGDLEKLNYVCNRCSHHERIGSEEYFSIIFDDGKYTELNPNITSGDPLSFEDTKKYTDRLKTTQKNTGLSDAVRTAKGKLNKKDFIVAAMDFKFIGGSMGSVMGEKIARAIDEALKLKCPIMIISKSGGARMMEAGFSLMQMAKISGKLGQLADAQLQQLYDIDYESDTEIILDIIHWTFEHTNYLVDTHTQKVYLNNDFIGTRINKNDIYYINTI